MQFLIVRMETHALAAPIVEELRGARQELEQAQTNYEETRTARLAATAEITYRDDRVDSAVVTLADEALVLFEQRDAAGYRRLFPVEPQMAIASTAGNRQHEFVRALIAELRSGAEYAPLGAHANVLTHCQDELEQALARRESRFVPEAQAVARRSEAIAAACRAYNRCHARLQLLRVDAVLLESLYPILSHGRPYDMEGVE